MTTADLLPGGKVRILIAPCGCMAAEDSTTNVPGFCRSADEAAEDMAAGFHEMTVERDVARARPMGCSHEPQWGVK